MDVLPIARQDRVNDTGVRSLLCYLARTQRSKFSDTID